MNMSNNVILAIYLAGIIPVMLLVYACCDRRSAYDRSEATEYAVGIGFLWPLVVGAGLAMAIVAPILAAVHFVARKLFAVTFREGS